MFRTLTLFLPLAMFFSCVKTPGLNGEMELDTDSVGCLVSRQGIEVEISADYPTRDTLLQSCLARYIVSQMLVSVPDSTQTKGTPLLQSCGEAVWDYIRQQCGLSEEEVAAMSEEEKTELPDPDGMMWSSSYTAHFAKVYDTARYVSWQYDSYLYVYATAHPSLGMGGVTFGKADGRRLETEILKDTGSQGFQRLLRDGLHRWIAENWEEDFTDEQLADLLPEGVTLASMPLPRQAPYLLPEGVALAYEPYELFSSSDAQVVVLPYEQVKPYLEIEI